MLHPPGNKALYPCEKGSESGEIGEPSQVRHQTSPTNGSFLFPECNRVGSIFTYIWLSVVVNVGTVSIPYMDPMGIYDSSSGKAHHDELFSSLTKCGTPSWVAKTLFHNMFFHPASPRGVFHQLWMMSFHHLFVPLSLRHLQKDCCSCTALLFLCHLLFYIHFTVKKQHVIPNQHTGETCWQIHALVIAPHGKVALRRYTLNKQQHFLQGLCVWKMNTCASTSFLQKTLPTHKQHDNGNSASWRCIAYWTWGFSNGMLVFRGVPPITHLQI